MAHDLGSESLAITWHGDDTASLAGDLSVENTTVLAWVWPALGLAAKQDDLTVDVAHVGFTDSVGLRHLLELARVAIDAEHRVTLLHPQPQLRRVLELAGVDAFFDLED
jgi:anti-anti-sigma factor